MSASAENGLILAALPVLREHEGERLAVYHDIYDLPTIGVGVNLTRPDAREMCGKCGANYDRLLGGLDELTEVQSRYLLTQLIIDTVQWLVGIFPAFWTYSQPRQVALVDQGFNLGETRFCGFRQEISHILAGEWAKAAQQVEQSQSAVALPERYAWIAGKLRQG